MSPFMTWFADNLGTILVGGFLVATVALLWGALATWRTAKRLRTPPRPFVRFFLSLILVLGSAGAFVFLGIGLREMGPGMWAQRGMLGEPAPVLEFALVESDLPSSLADYRGQVVLVNIWATWCPPCIAEMADLDRLQAAYAEEGLVILHVSDEDRETLLAWSEDQPTETVHAYVQPIPWPETGRPTTYVVDREGMLQRVLLGQRSYEEFETEVRRFL
jgi:cytochrome c biogenesis protein CcmG/thiol:disulfide interchange protein DsbE